MAYSSTIRKGEIRIFGLGLNHILEIPHLILDQNILKRDRRAIPFCEHIKLDLPWSVPNRLENICEQIGKEINAQDRRITVPFSGLLYHLFFNLGKEYGVLNYSAPDFCTDWEALKENRVHKQ